MKDMQFDPETAEGWEYIGDVMSNFDHEIEEGAEERLKAGKFYGAYPAWHFHAMVWWDGESFVARVKRYRVIQAFIKAASLQDLMNECSDQYGCA